MRVRLDVTGLDEIRQALAAGGDIVIERAKTTLSMMADRVISLGGPLVPVELKDGGRLAASLRKGRPTYLESRDVISVAVIAGGTPLDAFLAATHHSYNIYAALQEMDLGKGAPFAHARGQAHFIQRPAEMVAPSIPAEVLAAIKPEDLGGA